MRGNVVNLDLSAVILYLQVQFDADYEQGSAQAPPVMFCTDDGHLCRAQWGISSETALMQVHVNAQQRGSTRAEISTLLSEASSVNGFDIDGSDIVAVVEQECICYVKRRSLTF